MTLPRMKITVRSVDDRAEWLKWRRQNINASEIGILAGVDRFKTPLRLYAEKTGEVEEPAETVAMRRGRWFEDACINAFHEEHGGHVHRPNAYYASEPCRLGATPDAFWKEGASATAIAAAYDTLIQCKVIARPIFDKLFTDDTAPMSHLLQVQQELLLTGLTKGILAVLVIDTFTAELCTFPIIAHKDAQKRIIKMVDKFWSDCEAGREPKADYYRDIDLINKLYKPDDDVEALDLTSDNRIGELLSSREQWKGKEKEAKETCEAIDAEIVEKLNGATYALANGWKISRKLQHRKEYVVPANSFPVMRITKLKEKQT